MTSLAHQLKRLALPQNDPNLFTHKEVASLLFDPEHAATMDRNTFYTLGCAGLSELLVIEPAFAEFQLTLFSQASMTFERSVQSKEINAKLDEGISLFLARVYPYFLLKPAQKCLEWLIHRFHIQLYNVDTLLACVLPYHETKTFTRVVQLLKISEPTHRWHWLHTLQKSGVPLARGTLITHCSKDMSFLDFICTMVTKAIKAYSTYANTSFQLRMVFSFYASTIVSVLESVSTVTDTLISKLLPFVQMGLDSSLGDYRVATYMIVSQLAATVVMEGRLVNALALQVSKNLVKESVFFKEGLVCLIILLQHQKEGSVGPKAFDHLCCMSSLVETLQAISVVHDISPLLRYMLPPLVHSVVTTRYDKMEQDEEVPAHRLLLESIVRSLLLSKGLDYTVGRLLLEEYLQLGQPSAEHIAALNQNLLPLVRLFESKYCVALDCVLSGHTFDLADTEQKQLFHHFIFLSTSSGKFKILKDSDTSLLLSLKHVLPSVRTAAVEHLSDLLSSGPQENADLDFQIKALLERVQDDVPEVVAAALKALEVCMDRLDPEDTMSCLLSLLERSDLLLDGQWLPVLQDCVRLLSDLRLERGNAERLGWRLLPFLAVVVAAPDSPQFQLSICMATCPILAQHPLTQGWVQELGEVVGWYSGATLLLEANTRLVSTLTRNLALMDPFSKRSALEKLALAVEQPHGSGLRARTAVLVLSQALLRGLAQQSDTPHLVTAQRIYASLDRHLLEASRDANMAASVFSTSFPEALVVYLEKVQGGSPAHPEYRQVLLSLLHGFISTLKCPDPSFRGDTWWNPEKLDTNTCCYLHLLCRLFEVTIIGSRWGPAKRSYRELMTLLFQVHLSMSTDLFKFLCMLWGYGANEGDQLDMRVGAVLQTQSLYVGRMLLATMPAPTLHTLASAKTPVVPSLLGCLSSPYQEVRRAAIDVLDTLAQTTSAFQPIITRLLNNTEEITADPAHLSQVLGVLHEKVSANPKEATLGVAFQLLLQTITASVCPSYTAVTLLRALGHINGESVLSALMPVLDWLVVQSVQEPTILRSEAQLSQLVLGKYNDQAAPLLVKDQACLDLFIRALKSPVQPYPDIPSIQVMALEQITKSFFEALDDEKFQQQLLGVMFDLLVESRDPLVSNTISNVFKGLTVDAVLVAKELVPPAKTEVAVTVKQTRRRKTMKDEENSEAKPEEEAISWQRVTLVLELLQHKKKLKRAQALVPALFTLLARSLQLGPGAQGGMEYTRQLLLSCLYNVCHKLSLDMGPTAADVLDMDKFNVELVVQCVRVSDMPQTHHHALLLLDTVASIFPEKVLHNIMPIFTFMGANIMRLDDSYSFLVINKTVQTIIPALIKAHEASEGPQAGSIDVVVIKIVNVFVDALPHVPEHRRLPILYLLANALGPDRFLWGLLVLLFKQHATKTVGNPPDKDVTLERDMEFWVSLCCMFKVSEQLSSLIRILQYLSGMPQEKHDAEAPRRGARRKEPQGEEKVEELLFNTEAHSSKELRHFKFLSVNFTAQLLASYSFISKLAKHDEDIGLLQLQQSMLEETLCYIHNVARCVEDNSDKPTAKFWRALLNKVYDVLDKVESLLPTDTFIVVMKGLMGNHLPSVRRKALELLNNKLQHKTKWEDPQVTVLLSLSGDLLSIVGRGHCQITAKEEAMEEVKDEQAINRQTALYSLKLLCRNFGADHQEVFVPVLRRAVEVATTVGEEKAVVGSALLCIGQMVNVLKTLAIPQLPSLMPALLQAMEERTHLLSSDIYLLSAFTALQHVAQTLPSFVSPYLPAIVVQVCRISRLVETSSVSQQFSDRLASLSRTLATKVASRVLLPTLTKCYNDMVPTKQSHLGPLMSILKGHINHMEKDQLNSHQSELTSFFLTALDFRAQHCQGDLEKTAEVEGFTIDCLISMVMKLSEVTFRPLFFKLFDWSKTGSEGKQRLLTFYRLADRIADRLKGLFVLFAGNLVKPFSDLLQQTNVSKTDEALFDGEDGVQKSTLLLQYVLDCMFKIFLHDKNNFLSKDRAEGLMGPLVDQLENTLGGEEECQRRVTQHLVPCLGQFCVAMGDDTLWKTLNCKVLLKTRHSSSKVRFSTLLMVMELVRKLRENYMVLLPESSSFLAELMEDESEEVEHQAKKVIQEMENILGEPLQKYFDNTHQ